MLQDWEGCFHKPISHARFTLARATICLHPTLSLYVIPLACFTPFWFHSQVDHQCDFEDDKRFDSPPRRQAFMDWNFRKLKLSPIKKLEYKKKRINYCHLNYFCPKAIKIRHKIINIHLGRKLFMVLTLQPSVRPHV